MLVASRPCTGDGASDVAEATMNTPTQAAWTIEPLSLPITTTLDRIAAARTRTHMSVVEHDRRLRRELPQPRPARSRRHQWAAFFLGTYRSVSVPSNASADNITVSDSVGCG